MGSPSDWQLLKRKVVQRGKHILETSQWSDCEFIVGQEPHQEILEGHKLFLAMSSPVFEAMFFGGMAEKNDPIPVRDVQPEAFKALLEYIYTDNIDLSSFELACELCYCAIKYMLPFLVEQCTKFLESNVSPKTACRAYELAKLFEEPVLIEKCVDIICTKTISVLSEESFDEINVETLEMILDLAILEINSEIELLSATERWARSECSRQGLDPEDRKSLRSVIGNALTKIRFLSLTLQQFANGIAKSSLLTKDEAFAIFMNISSSESKCSMPDGFSTNTRSRVLTVQYDGQIPLSSLTNYISRHITESSLPLTVNRDIIVIGVQVLIGNTSDNESSFDTQLLDPNGMVITGKNCAAPPHDKAYVEVIFDRPVDIQRNKVYCIRVAFNHEKQYFLTPYFSQMTCGPVLFSLGVKNALLHCRHTVIRSIIYGY